MAAKIQLKETVKNSLSGEMYETYRFFLIVALINR